ncbi:alpha/beta hydrolase family protein [Mycolicibacterium arenosum]|uniref:Alpha/beta fold hydrolase n=1 Tax=Mycolicibacterium arenosum TaxID=2952157 RepID=A0ABT1MBE3_9MYCO|nr:alpha/beta fold hydrolase [Mycolicibacterium sp. CAU 1645]MCP9276471.1 alpha/beta fold hydrolase [Mycolicibacterium sp. CAU 1645]
MTAGQALAGVGLSIAILVSGCSPGNAPAPAPLPTANDSVTVHRIDYTTRGLGDPAQNWGDFYLPAGPQAVDSIPLVVLIHGGSWKSRLGATTMSPYARDLAAKGMAVYNIEYRRVGSGGGWPTTFEDVADALDYVVELKRQFPQITTNDELVVGHSAGGQLAAWVGTRNRLNPNEVGSRPLFQPTRIIALAGPLDMVYAADHGDRHVVAVLGGTPQEVPERYQSVDPIQNIDPAIPILAVHGDADRTVPVVLSQRYIDEVVRQRGIGEIVIAAGENHVSIVDPKSPMYARILDTITDVSIKTIAEIAVDFRTGG